MQGNKMRHIISQSSVSLLLSLASSLINENLTVSSTNITHMGKLKWVYVYETGKAYCAFV
jgi:hypothetical protein